MQNNFLNNLRGKLVILLFIGVTSSLWLSCNNPFAPRLVDKPILDAGLGDQTTVDGIFQNFRYAYLTKDTLVYGRLLAQNFTFIYRNYDKGIDYTWSRDEDMVSTAGLFQTAQQLNLVWNDVVVTTGDTLLLDISRGFNLSITFDPTDIVQVQGRVNLRLKRSSTKDKWLIYIWRDESNF